MSLETVTRLYDLTGVDRRTIKERCLEVPKIEQGKRELMESRKALPVIYQLIDDVDEELNAKKNRAKILFFQAERERIRVEEMKGQIMSIDEIVETTGALVTAARATLLSLHNKIAMRHPDLPADVISDIQDVVFEALNELADDGLSEETRRRLRAFD